MKRRDDDLERFQDGLDKTLLIDAIRKGMSLNEALTRLGTPSQKYGQWFNDDVEFRVRIYAAITAPHMTAEQWVASMPEE